MEKRQTKKLRPYYHNQRNENTARKHGQVEAAIICDMASLSLTVIDVFRSMKINDLISKLAFDSKHHPRVRNCASLYRISLRLFYLKAGLLPKQVIFPGSSNNNNNNNRV